MVKQGVIIMDVIRTNVILKSDIKRVLLRPFYPTTDPRVTKIIKRIQALSEVEVNQEVQMILTNFNHRHRGYKSFLLSRFEQIRDEFRIDRNFTKNRKFFMCMHHMVIITKDIS